MGCCMKAWDLKVNYSFPSNATTSPHAPLVIMNHVHDLRNTFPDREVSLCKTQGFIHIVIIFFIYLTSFWHILYRFNMRCYLEPQI